MITSGQVSEAVLGSVLSIAGKRCRQYREADRKRCDNCVLRAQKNADAVTDLQHREDVEKSDDHVPAPCLKTLDNPLD